MYCWPLIVFELFAFKISLFLLLTFSALFFQYITHDFIRFPKKTVTKKQIYLSVFIPFERNFYLDNGDIKIEPYNSLGPSTVPFKINLFCFKVLLSLVISRIPNSDFQIKWYFENSEVLKKMCNRNFRDIGNMCNLWSKFQKMLYWGFSII